MCGVRRVVSVHDYAGPACQSYLSYSNVKASRVPRLPSGVGTEGLPEVMKAHTRVYTGMPNRCANALASDRQFCFDPLQVSVHALH